MLLPFMKNSRENTTVPTENQRLLATVKEADVIFCD